MMKNLLLLLVSVMSFGAVSAYATETCAAPGENYGYRVHHYVRDPALHAAWAVLVDCLHPASPGKVVPVAEIPSLSTLKPLQFEAARPFEVQAGNPVRVWMANGNTQMNLEAIAMAGGAHGATIPIRLLGMSGSRGVLHGTVRGPGSVELSSSDSKWRKQP